MANANSTTLARPELTRPFIPAVPATSVETLLTRPIHYGLDFMALAHCCSALVAELLENDDPTSRLALAGRLALSLSLMRHVLNDDLTPEQCETLTVAQKPQAAVEPLYSEPELLVEYCHSLTQVLLSGAVRAEPLSHLSGLLFELVNQLCDTLTAPRFYRSAEGLRDIETGQMLEMSHQPPANAVNAAH
ncbi:hypothetical protein [Atlantibacter hermannii]|uniref:hypothetical protein n=1 Tax=Atlantibacter hermannii TaxID=565 RepID=UPI00193318D4|nr:hypothetical protein [Atlantibacter hermannii]MBL7637996.1 hypothetical protein [Atlantibacter hermannii]MBL7676211.1 hypothetical protein [Atlantibacter hermannii]